MNKRILFAFLCLALGFSACQKAPELSITGPTSVDISADGSSASITFTTNRDWSVTWSESWISVSPSSGSASDGQVTVTIRCNPNDTYEDRSGTVTIKAEGLTQTISVRQPANKGIIVPTKSYDLSSNANTIEVEVQANVQYSVSISDNWIKQTGTKGLTRNILVFSVEENTTYDGRSASITIKSQTSGVPDQVISVRQSQKDALIVKDTSFNMPYGGGEVEVKVEANVSFDVKPSVDWIHFVKTKALNSSTVCLTIDENPTTSKREGKVEIVQKNGSLSHSVTVKQAGRIAVSSVTLNKTSIQLKEGESETLIATVKPDNATDKTVTWSSSNETIASVDDNGKVIAKKEGTATITASAGGKKATCSITVKNDIDVTSVQIKQYLYLAVGESETLEATVKPDDATDKTVTWKSSNNSIVSVDSQGKVTAKGKGNATISATAGSVGAECTVFVKAKRYDAANGAIDLGLSVMWATKNYGASTPSDVGGYYLWGDPTGSGQIAFFNTPNVNYISGTQYDIATRNLGNGWRIPTNDEIMELLDFCDIKDISQNGNQGLQFTGPNGQSIFIPLSGLAYPADGAIGSTSIQSADRAYLMAGESYADGNGRFAYVWYFDQNNSFGQVSYNAPFVKIPVRPVYEKLEDDIPVSSVSLNTNSLSLKEGESATLVATVSPNNATDKTVTWSSSDKSIATVSSNGKVTAVKTGSAKITAQAGDKTATCLVSVQTASIKVTSITLNKSSITLSVGSSETLIATLYPSNATETVHWGSSNPDVASVDSNGKVTGVTAGSAIITAIAGEKTATCNVTVTSSGQTGNIVFADANIKAKLVAAFDSNNDGEISYSEATAAKSIEGVFGAIKTYTSFDEFVYFTNIERVPKEMFKNWNLLRSITLPPSIIEIGASAFEGCFKLSEIKNMVSVQLIQSKGFKDCSGLERIDLPETLVALGGSAFSGCTKLKSITIPPGVRSLPFELLSGATNLVSVSIPTSVQTIGYNAFKDCINLSAVRLPNGLSSIDYGAFSGCRSLKEIVIPDSVTSISGMGNGEARLYKGAFYGCTSLESVKLGSGLTMISNATFNMCQKLREIELGPQIKSIGTRAFEDCTSLNRIDIPDSVEGIGAAAFRGCGSLKTIKLPESISTIGKYCFSNSGLESVSLPQSLSIIDDYVFASCKSLTMMYIPESITSIGGWAFSGCTSLKKITFPASITSIGRASFQLVHLTEIKALALTPPDLESGAISVFDDQIVYVPKSVTDAYKNHSEWGKFGDRIRALQE